ncbi:RNA polymerase sigma factor [Candidatus Peregrinibacteria bacterium]|nr:RNA polymerase sigma factor [Candidatus Peregrinibacteria bacterium]
MQELGSNDPHFEPDVVQQCPPWGEDGRTVLAYFKQSRNSEAFSLLYRHYAPLLIPILTSRDISPEAAEDAVQETFAHVFADPSSYQEGVPVFPWLIIIARNKALDTIRSYKRFEKRNRRAAHKRNEKQGLDPANDLMRREEMILVRGALERALWNPKKGGYDDELMQMFILRISGETFETIARVYDHPMTTVASRIYALLRRARRAMRPSPPDR